MNMEMFTETFVIEKILTIFYRTNFLFSLINMEYIASSIIATLIIGVIGCKFEKFRKYALYGFNTKTIMFVDKIECEQKCLEVSKVH